MAAPRIPGWQQTILKGIGAPDTPQNELFVNDWAKAEGGSAENNPFNTTQPVPGALGNYNSVGVKRYASPQQGIAATLATLKNGRYGSILQALRQGTDAKASARALAGSPWGTGALVLKMLGGTPGASPASPMATATPVQPAVAPRATGPSPFIQGLLATTSQILGTAPMALPSGPSLPAAAAAGALTPRIPAAPVSPSTGGGKLAIPIRGTIGNEDPNFLSELTGAARARGAVAILATSGERTPGHNTAIGGAQHSNHLADAQGNAHALDGYAILRDGSRVPLGQFLKPNASSFGLRSGATFTWGGGPDLVHVDDFHNGGR